MGEPEPVGTSLYMLLTLWPVFFFLINISIISNMNNKVDHFNKF